MLAWLVPLGATFGGGKLDERTEEGASGGNVLMRRPWH